MPNVVRMTCLIHENSPSKQQVKYIESETKRLYQNHFGQKVRVVTIWMTIPPGQAYIAGKPSTASTVSISAPDGTKNERRHAFMTSFCNMWMETTGCNENEIILSVMDLTLGKEYISKSLGRIAPKKRMSQGLKLVSRLLSSRFSKGYLSSSINMK